MRIRRKIWADDELTTNENIVKNPEEQKGNWKNVFGNDNRIELEIGCGRGRFIKEKAKQNADINYIAVERQENILAIASRKSREERLKTKFIRIDADELLNIFSAGEVETIYLNFSDPWPNKKKWAKKRLTYVKYLRMYEEILAKDGVLKLKTDNQALFEFTKEQMSENNWKFEDITDKLTNNEIDNIETEYEQKFKSQNMKIYGLIANPNRI